MRVTTWYVAHSGEFVVERVSGPIIILNYLKTFSLIVCGATRILIYKPATDNHSILEWIPLAYLGSKLLYPQHFRGKFEHKISYLPLLQDAVHNVLAILFLFVSFVLLCCYCDYDQVYMSTSNPSVQSTRKVNIDELIVAAVSSGNNVQVKYDKNNDNCIINH